MIESLAPYGCRPIQAIVVNGLIRHAEIVFACDTLGIARCNQAELKSNSGSIAAYLSQMITYKSGLWIVSCSRNRLTPQVDTIWIWGTHGWKDPRIPVYTLERIKENLTKIYQQFNPFVLELFGNLKRNILI
jgi:hypothetical protein